MGNDKKDSKHVFRFRMSKPGPSAPSTNPTSEPGAGSSQTSVASLEIQQPVVTKGKSWRSRLWNRSRPPSPVPPVTLPGTATPTPTPDLAPPPDVTSVVEPTSGPTPTPNLATTPDVTSVVEPTSEPTPEHQPVASANQTLWQEALEKIAVEDKLGVDLNAGSLLRNLIDSTKERKLEIEKKQWVYKNKDGETVVYADRFLTLLNKYAGIVDIAIQHDPHVVALVWSGFRFLLQVATADMENVRMVFRNLEVLLRILFRCDIYEKLYSSKLHATAQLNTSIVQLYVAILKYLCSARRELSLPTGARVLKSVLSDSGQLFKDIQSCEKEVQTDADMAEKEAAATESYAQEERTQDLKIILAGIRQPIQDIVRTIAKMNKSVDGAKRARILMWMSDIPVQDHHIFSRERRHQDTGDWLLQHVKFREWRGSNFSSMLWLRGGAGAGKTILASKVVDEFQSRLDTELDATAYFYCNYRDAARKDPASVFRALVKQLCLHSPSKELPEPVLSVYQAREENGHQSGALHLNESRDLIVQLATGFSQTTIVIDALDECHRDTRRDLFLALKHIVDSTRNVRIFLTGRSDGDIKRILCDFPSHYIEASDNQGDIGTYINSEIERCCREKLLLDGEIDEVLKSDIVSALTKGADGMYEFLPPLVPSVGSRYMGYRTETLVRFMWVHLQFSAICRGRTPGGIRNALRTLPKGLDETYIMILKRIADTETAETVRVANTVLKWILYAQTLCTAELISQVLSVGVAATDGYRWKQPAILDICQNLVVYDGQLETFRFAHFSVHEFLVGQPGFDEEETHAGIAEICLTVFLRQPDTTDSELLEYSTLHWAAHVRLSGGGGNSALESLLKEFLQPSPAYRAWHSRVYSRHPQSNRDTEYWAWPSQLYAYSGRHPLSKWDSDVVTPLFVACHYELYSIFKFLLGNGGNSRCIDDAGRTLLYAAEHGYYHFVELMIESQYVDVNFRGNRGQTALMVAAEQDHEGLVQLLLAKDGVDPDSKDNYGRTPLSLAAESRKSQLRYAKENGRRTMPFKDREGPTPPPRAAELGTQLLRGTGVGRAVVRMLLEKDRVDPNSRDNNGGTPLWWAAFRGNETGVQMLLAKDGVDPDSKDNDGKTPLLLAAANGNEQVVRMLLEKGEVDPGSKDNAGLTSLGWAAMLGQIWMIQLLLEKDGVDLNSKDNNGRTPLSWAAAEGHDEVVRLLLENDGLDPDSEDNYGWRPLRWAAERGHDEVVRMLLENDGVDPDSKDNIGRTPLSLAAVEGHEGVVRMLLENDGVDPDSKDKVGRTPLSWAAVEGHEGVVRMLLAKDGVDPDSKDNVGRTPLSWAADGQSERLRITGQESATPKRELIRIGFEEDRKLVVRMLLAKDGVDPGSEDNDGLTPLRWAEAGQSKRLWGKSPQRYRRRISVRENGKVVVWMPLANDGVDPDYHDAVVDILEQALRARASSQGQIKGSPT